MRGGPVRRWLEVQVRTLDGHTQLSTGFEHLKQAQTVTVSTKCCVLNARWKMAHWTITFMKNLIRDRFSKLYISPRNSVRGYDSNFKDGPAASQRLVIQTRRSVIYADMYIYKFRSHVLNGDLSHTWAPYALFPEILSFSNVFRASQLLSKLGQYNKFSPDFR